LITGRNDREEVVINESESIGEETLQTVQAYQAERDTARHLYQSAAQTATGLVFL